MTENRPPATLKGRRIRSAAEAWAWLEPAEEVQAETRAPVPAGEALAWLTRLRKRTRGLPYLELVGEDLVSELEQGRLEYVGLAFVPRQADVARGYLLWGTLALIGESLSLSEFSVAPLDPSAYGVSAEVLRRISVSSILARVHAELANRADLGELARRLGWVHAPSEEEQVALDQLAARAAAGRARPGRPALSDADLERIAQAYLRKQAEGVGHGILLVLAEEEGCPRDTMRDWVAKARRRGFLSPGTPGRAGALPGARLQREAAVEEG